jgi:acyl-coenzyme A thioesterase PaaI-like protein
MSDSPGRARILRTEGRKIFTGTALYDEDGTPVAVGSALMIVLLPKV